MYTLQANLTLQPRFLSSGLGNGTPGLQFDGAKTFLANSSAVITNASTMFAVFRDDGSTCDCCSGVLFYEVG
jgi:hypothetical protein